MNITRIGFVVLIVGAILFMNASSSHVSGYSTHNYGSLKQNETQAFVILIAPVGPVQIAIGGADHPFLSSPGGGTNVVANVSVHVKITDPQNKTLVEQDVISPHLLNFEFKERGAYTVSVTNKDPEETTMPITVIFDANNPQNREADKFLLSITLTTLGAVIVSVGLVINFVSNHRKQTQKKVG